jgi:hypothetical protein
MYFNIMNKHTKVIILHLLKPLIKKNSNSYKLTYNNKSKIIY